jgi:thioesterase domain-containing protein
MEQIQSHFGREFPLAMLFENGTVERMARILRKGFTAPPDSPLAPMKPGGSRRPLFFVHVGSGNVLAYVDLVRHLHPDQPFYGIQDPHLHSDEPPQLSIEEMASAYIELIREVQPTGPYALGGWSFGGIVAYEMAQQLSRMGEQVSRLFLLDTSAPEIVIGIAHRTTDAVLLTILAMEVGLDISLADLEGLDSDEQLSIIGDKMAQLRPILGKKEKTIAHFKSQLAIFRSRVVAICNYKPARYSGRVLFFNATATDGVQERHGLVGFTVNDPSKGWGSLVTGPFEIKYVSESHHGFARGAHAKYVAGAIEESLAAIDKDAVSSVLKTEVAVLG